MTVRTETSSADAIAYLLECFIKYHPDDDRLWSKHVAVSITKNKAVLTVFN